ncbi:Gfo/Idh/MocA family protein [Allorhizocola rhizosphaerae]|uniref:Gfo/Idh/MocA family protein n=1 Tax=Allorhizocola rhizosphaerae TaxID=1872709 RepID=UPI000E3B7D7B|nr:Gfo/Idh/MocA family oxidoreductase [Allorhizocola rhizosphaerae]
MTRVALIGANGHGVHHREVVTDEPLAELVGLSDVSEVHDPPVGVPVFTDADVMLKSVEPDVVIVSTPPATHLPLAVAALRAGADVLLEKPPVLDLAQHEALSAVESETGRVVQVGFQALASPDLPRLREYHADVSVVGAWFRDSEYWTRSPWAGRPPLDGALRNPFAHAIMQALAVVDAPPVRVEVAWARSRGDIEVDDISTLRLGFADGRRVLVGVSLASDEEFIDGELRTGPEVVNFREFEGVSLLHNLIQHRLSDVELLAPLALTRGFTAVVEALGALPAPGLLKGAPAGIAGILRRCAADFALLNEIEAPWTANATGGAANIAD